MTSDEAAADRTDGRNEDPTAEPSTYRVTDPSAEPATDRGEAEYEVALAYAALDGKDFDHAAYHLGIAIAADPSVPDVYRALHDLDSAVAGAIDLFPLGEQVFAGTVAARSYLCARAGRLDEALALIAMVTAHEPRKPWTTPGWLEAPGVAAALDPGAAAAALIQLAAGLPEPVPGDLIPALSAFLDLTRALVAAHPDNVEILPPLSGLARRLGRVDDAVAWCARAEREQPSAASAVMLAYALRAAGRHDDMLDAFATAAGRDGADADVYVDVAAALAGAGRHTEALGALDRALAVEPDHPDALPAACALRHATDGDAAHLIRLADFASTHPESAGPAYDTLAQACADRPWLQVVPAPREAVCHLLAQLAEQYPEPADRAQVGGTGTLPALEAPSAMAAVRAALPLLKIAVGDVPEPDMRVPLAEVTHQVWRYERTAAVPVAPAPSARAADTLTAVARRYWPHPPAAYEQAAALAEVSLDDLLGLLVHVPPPPDDETWRGMRRTRPDYWPRFAQAWTCLGVLHHRPDQPWPESTRRAVLVDLAMGVEDWVTDAALAALVVAAWVDPQVRPDVAAVVGHRFLEAARAYQSREVGIMRSLAQLVLITPGIPAEMAGLARDLLAAAEHGAHHGQGEWYDSHDHGHDHGGDACVHDGACEHCDSGGHGAAAPDAAAPDAAAPDAAAPDAAAPDARGHRGDRGHDG